MPSDLSRSLRQFAAGLREVEVAPGQGTSSQPELGALDLARRGLLARLDQDLLPRTAGGPGYLAVGIVGPNNAGKSALFNGLAGAVLSPSMPTGGATRRLLAALGPELLVALQGEPASLGLRLIPVEPGPDGVDAARSLAQAPSDLLCVAMGHLPPGLLLVDTPDFDSVAQENRAASEALLRAVDLALVVVTRHTYQNAEVVRFLGEWLAHGKPWALVYNESIDPETTAEHAAKLASDVGAAPLETFAAPFDPEVARGVADLVPRSAAGLALGEWLASVEDCAALKARAMDAALEHVRQDWAAFRAQLMQAEAELGLEYQGLHARAFAVGRSVAEEAMPMGPFLEAFRAVLDRRPGLLPTGYRAWLGRARGVLADGVNKLPWSGRAKAPPESEPDAEGPGRALLEAEREALAKLWSPFFEGLAASYRGSSSRQEPPDLAAGRLVAAGRQAAERLAEDPAVLEEFQAACEQRMEEEFDARGEPFLLQAGVDAMHLFPAAVAGLVILKTGGLGADVAVGGAGALSTLVSERLSRLLGTGVASAARTRWSELRGKALAPILLECALPASWPALCERRASLGEARRRLDPLAEFLETRS